MTKEEKDKLAAFPRRNLFSKFLGTTTAIALAPEIIQAEEVLAPQKDVLIDIISKLEARVRTLENKLEKKTTHHSSTFVGDYTISTCYLSSYAICDSIFTKKIP